MKFGTMQFVLGDKLPGVFTSAAELGFDGVELDWSNEEEISPGKPLAPSQRAAIKSAAAAAGVQISSVCAHLMNNPNLASPDPAARATGQRLSREGIQLCQDLGAPLMLLPFFGPADFTPKGIDQLVLELKSLAAVAAKAKIKVGIEHPMPGALAAQVVDRVASPWIGDYWDMANGMALSYDPLQDVEALKGRLFQVHAKEFFAKDGPPGSLAKPRFDALNSKPLGQGAVPLANVVKALKSIGYDGYVVLETGGFGQNHASAKAALELLKKLFSTTNNG